MSLIHSDTSIAVVAVGPGDSSLMTLQGREILENADVVAGFKTVLDVVRPWIVNADARDMTYRDQEEVLEYVESQALLGKKCVVCAWGDLNSSARELVARVRRRADRVELTPGISSVQVACVRAGIAAATNSLAMPGGMRSYGRGSIITFLRPSLRKWTTSSTSAAKSSEAPRR